MFTKSDRSVGEILKLAYGASLPEAKRYGHRYPVLGSGGLAGFHDSFLVTGPGIVVGRKGSVGTVMWSEDAFWPIDTTYYVVPQITLNLRWCFWLLQCLSLEKLDSSTGVPGLNRNDVYPIRIWVPSVDEQRQIAQVIDVAENALHQGERLVKKLKRMKAGLLRNLLTRGLDEKGQLRDPVLHPELFRESQLGPIPEEWQVTTLATVASVDRGKFVHRPRNDPRYYGGSYPFIQTNDVTRADGGILETYSQTLNDNGAKVSREFPGQTIAVTIAANIADTAILGMPMYFPDSVVGINAYPPHNVRYFELWIRNAKERLEAIAPQSAQKNINLQDLRYLPIALPRPEEQVRIARTYELFDARIRAEEAHRDKLTQIKQGLIDDLLTGRVRV